MPRKFWASTTPDRQVNSVSLPELRENPVLPTRQIWLVGQIKPAIRRLECVSETPLRDSPVCKACHLPVLRNFRNIENPDFWPGQFAPANFVDTKMAQI
jgi:hypothetical protein